MSESDSNSRHADWVRRKYDSRSSPSLGNSEEDIEYDHRLSKMEHDSAHRGNSKDYCGNNHIVFEDGHRIPKATENQQEKPVAKQQRQQQWFIRTRSESESEFRSHFLYQNLSIAAKDEDEFVRLLIPFLSIAIGRVTFLDKLKREGDKLTIGVGLRSDSEAVKYLDSNTDSLQIEFHDTLVRLVPIVSSSFRYYFPEAKRLRNEEIQREERIRLEEQQKRQEQEKAQQLQKQRERERERQKAKERERERELQRQRNRKSRTNRSRGKDKRQKCQRFRRSKEDSRNRQRSWERKRSRSRSRSRNRKHYKRRSSSRVSERSHNNKSLKDQATLRIFGIPKKFNEKDVLLTLKHHPDGPFILTNWSWQTIGGTSCFKINLSEKNAYYLLKRRKNIEGDEVIPLIIQSGRQESQIRSALAQCQLRITYPQPIEPSNLYIVLSQYGQLVQMTAENRLNTSFIVTFSSSKPAKLLRDLNTKQDFVISAVSEGQVVHRPGYRRSLKELMKGVKLAAQVKKRSRT